jgi:hypothetical protein
MINIIERIFGPDWLDLFNPYHDQLGRFTGPVSAVAYAPDTGASAGGATTVSDEETPKARGNIDKLQKNFKKVHSVKSDGDYILITYQTKMGNLGYEDGSKSHPTPRLEWLMEKAREAGKMK